MNKTKEEFLRDPLTAYHDAWAEGDPGIPIDWFREAWDAKTDDPDQSLRNGVVENIWHEANKGVIDLLAEGELRWLGRALRPNQWAALYQDVRSREPHRDEEIRQAFVQAAPNQAVALPPPLTKRQIVGLLGSLETAEQLGVFRDMPTPRRLQDGDTMGDRATFYQMSQEDFARRDEPCDQSSPLAERPSFSLGKFWFNFHLIFRDRPEPLCSAIQGDIRPVGDIEGNLIVEGDEDDEGEISGPYRAFVTPGTVQRVAAELQKLPRWKVFEMLRKVQPEWLRYKESRDRFAEAYETLQKGYSNAARAKAALEVFIL